MQKFLVALILSMAVAAVFAQQPPAAYVRRCSSISGRNQVFSGRVCPGTKLRLLDPENNFVCCADPDVDQQREYARYLQWCTSGSSNSQIAKAFFNKCPSLQTSRNGDGLGALFERTLDWGKDKLVCCYASALDRAMAATAEGVSSASRAAINSAVAFGKATDKFITETAESSRKGLEAADKWRDQQLQAAGKWSREQWNAAGKATRDGINAAGKRLDAAGKWVDDQATAAKKATRDGLNAAGKSLDAAGNWVADNYNAAAKSVSDSLARQRAFEAALRKFQSDCRRNTGHPAEVVHSYFARVPDNRVVCRDGASPTGFFKLQVGRMMCCPRPRA